MAYKWIAAAKGIRYREHETRKHGKKPDRYWVIQYHKKGKTFNEAVGWWSQGASQALAEEILSKLRQNWLLGQGPQTLRELRASNTAARESQAQEQARIEREATSITYFWETIYLPAATVKKDPETIKGERFRFNRWIKPVVGHLPMKDITSDHVEEIISRLRDAGKAPRTQEHVKANLSGILSQAINKGAISGPNPCRRVKLAKKDNKRVRFLSPDEARKLLDLLKLRSQQVHDAALLSLFCGLRAKEIFSLTWGDVDFINRTIFIKDSKHEKVNRHVFLTSEVREMLDNRKPKQPSPTGLIFPKEDGTQQKAVPITFRNTVSDLGWNEGITDRRLKLVFHSLRHTFASWLVQDGVPLFTVSKLMGHSTFEMTMRYAHLAPDNYQQTAGKLEGKLRASSVDNKPSSRLDNMDIQ